MIFKFILLMNISRKKCFVAFLKQTVITSKSPQADIKVLMSCGLTVNLMGQKMCLQ